MASKNASSVAQLFFIGIICIALISSSSGKFSLFFLTSLFILFNRTKKNFEPFFDVFAVEALNAPPCLGLCPNFPDCHKACISKGFPKGGACLGFSGSPPASCSNNN